MSLVNWGGNARYLQIDPAKAVKISETVDPVSAVCLAETYLAAYQILFHGIVGAKRQKKGSLGGKTYMLSGLIDPKLARAIAAIAKYAGVHAIYASAKCKYNRYFQKLGIVPFDQERDDLTAAKKGKFDRLVSFHQDLSKSHFDVLKKEGDIIVVCGIGGAFESREPSKLQPNIFCSRYKSQHYGKTYNYDVFEEWAERNEQCKSDLSFLVGLLSKGIIAPHIHHRISLRQVGKAQEMLESKQFSGFIVCEPWLVSKSRALRL
jgi:NADPH:quinone reductase-like Zn-dependent oxidoreductase